MTATVRSRLLMRVCLDAAATTVVAAIVSPLTPVLTLAGTVLARHRRSTRAKPRQPLSAGVGSRRWQAGPDLGVDSRYSARQEACSAADDKPWP